MLWSSLTTTDTIPVNDAACELFGLEREELLGRQIAEFAAPDFETEQVWSEFLAGDNERGQFPLQRPDGTVRLVEHAATPDIVPGEHLSILRDITEREQQHRALEESQARYQTLVEDVLDTSSVGTFILDANFDIVWINSAIEDYFGIEREEVVGQDKEALIQSRLKQKFKRPERFAEKVLNTYRNNTTTEEFECQIRDEGTETWRWLRHWSQPIQAGLYKGGRIEHYTDLTDVKLRDRQLKVLARVLRHNIYNSMTVIQGGAETIAADTSGEAKHHAERIVQTGQKLLELTDKQKRIVELISNNYGREPIDIDDLVRKVVAEVERDSPDVGITIRVSSDVAVLAVPDIGQAIAELVENAVEHSQGEPEIEVSVSESNQRTTVSIIDNNSPIPDLEKSVLHGDVEISQLSHSRGLGLWLANWLVIKSGGAITFGSYEQGNAVNIELPQSRKDEGSDTP